MSISLWDSAFFRDMVSTPPMRAVFSDEARIRAWLEVLGAQAEIQGSAGLIPADCARQITAAARGLHLDPAELAEEASLVGRPILPLVRRLSAACPDEAGKWVHYHGTTQDILDTGAALQQSRAMALVRGALARLISALCDLAEAHANTPMAGRTNGRQARPITFGFKVAGWASELDRADARLAEVTARAICVQFGGAVGSFAAPAPGGPSERAALMKALGLPAPDIAWQAARDRPAEVVMALSLLAAALGRLGRDIGRLSADEVGEVELCVPDSEAGLSSAMPHKRNPRDLEIMGAVTALVAGLPSAALGAMGEQADERHGSGWIPEWEIVPQAFLLASGSLAAADRVVSGLRVDPARMRENFEHGILGAHADRLASHLEPRLGARLAHELVREACQDAAVRLAPEKLFGAVSRRAAARGLELEEPEGLAPHWPPDTGLAAEECLGLVRRLRRAKVKFDA